jgi:uncharacterized membrane protein HdeD (DUF308 family)
MTTLGGSGGPDVRDQVVELGRAWWWFAFFGALSFLIGILVLVWPGHTLVALAVLFGLQLVVSGIFRLVQAVALTDVPGGARALMAILGLLGLLVGLYALRHIDIALSILALLLAIYWIIDGIVGIFAFIDHPGLPGRLFVGVSAVLAILFGIILIVWPKPTLLVLAVILGLFLLGFGVLQLVIAFGLRAATRH